MASDVDVADSLRWGGMPNRSAGLFSVSLLTAACIVACGSKPLTPDSGATGAIECVAGTTGTAGLGAEAGRASIGDAKIPLQHRATASCPTQRGPGDSSQPYPPGRASPLAPDAGGCTSDSDCKAGMNGRCYPFEGLVGPGGCSYDACLTDSNCGSKTPCVCRSSCTDTNPNFCDPGGNCAVDSDCGPGGYCSPSWEGCGYCSATSEKCGEPLFYCHTTRDTCINDADCPFVDAGADSCPTLPPCAYNPQAQGWECRQKPIVCCPP